MSDHPRAGWFTRLVGALVVVVGLVAGAGFVRDHVDSNWFGSGPSHSRVVTPPPAPPPPMDVPTVVAAVSPALVNIDVTIGPLDAGGSGTGIVLSPDGRVLTSHHVIKGATSITVTDVGNGVSYHATTLGYDITHDIALLQLTAAEGLPSVKIGDSNTLRVGQDVVALGNAGGVGGEPTVSPGRTSALNGSITARNEYDGSRKSLENLIEIEADVRAGQSGGALVNSSSEVVGVIAAASLPQQEESDGDAAAAAPPADPTHGYAVPIDQAMKIVEQIEQGRESDTVHVGPTAILGAYIRDSPLGRPQGAFVEISLYGSPAYEAGLSQGDIITSIDDLRVDSNSALRAELGRRDPGDQVRLDVVDSEGATRTVQLTLAEGTP